MHQHWRSSLGCCQKGCSRPPGRLPRTLDVRTGWAGSEELPEDDDWMSADVVWQRQRPGSRDHSDKKDRSHLDTDHGRLYGRCYTIKTSIHGCTVTASLKRTGSGTSSPWSSSCSSCDRPRSNFFAQWTHSHTVSIQHCRNAWNGQRLIIMPPPREH